MKIFLKSILPISLIVGTFTTATAASFMGVSSLPINHEKNCGTSEHPSSLYYKRIINNGDLYSFTFTNEGGANILNFNYKFNGQSAQTNNMSNTLGGYCWSDYPDKLWPALFTYAGSSESQQSESDDNWGGATNVVWL